MYVRTRLNTFSKHANHSITISYVLSTYSLTDMRVITLYTSNARIKSIIYWVRKDTSIRLGSHNWPPHG